MRSFAFAVVALAVITATLAVSEEDLPHNDFFSKTQACIPNKRFVDVCNECTCLPSGTQAACGRMYCRTRPEKPRIDGFLIEDNLSCPPGQKFFDVDVECTCNEDGKNADCSSDKFAEASAVPEEDLPHNDFFSKIQVCIPNQKFIDVCNHCTCLANGKQATCSKMYCSPSVKPRIDGFSTGNGLFCPAGQKFFDNDIECTCSEDGKTANCDSDVSTVAPETPVQNYPHNDFFGETEVCIPRQIFIDRCNLCTCNNSGNGADCTRMYCPAPKKPRIDGFVSNNGLVCLPGNQFYDNDIKCICSKTGRNARCKASLKNFLGSVFGSFHL